MQDTNRMNPAEREATDILVEEAGEVVQAVGKLGRHGFIGNDVAHSGMMYDNRTRLRGEVYDVLAATAICWEIGLINGPSPLVAEALPLTCAHHIVDALERKLLRTHEPELRAIIKQLISNYGQNWSGKV